MSVNKNNKTMARKPKAPKQEPFVKNSGPKDILKPQANDRFELPASFLSQLNEFSGGGYILLRLDSKRQPSVSARFDTDADALALYSWGQQYMQTVNDVFNANIQNSIVGELPMEEGPQDEGI